MVDSLEDLPVVEDWFRIDPADEHGIRHVREPHIQGGNIWFIEGSDKCLLVDTGTGVGSVRTFLETVTRKPIIAFALVGYYDHAGGLHQFDERLIHESDAHRVRLPNRQKSVVEFYFEQSMKALPTRDFDPGTYGMKACEPTRLLKDGDTIDLGDRSFEVLHLPGITDGTCGLFEKDTGVLFTGEAFVWEDMRVYDGEPADRSDDADQAAFCRSIKRLAELPATVVYPGHAARSDAATMGSVIGAYLNASSSDSAERSI